MTAGLDSAEDNEVGVPWVAAGSIVPVVILGLVTSSFDVLGLSTNSLDDESGIANSVEGFRQGGNAWLKLKKSDVEIRGLGTRSADIDIGRDEGKSIIETGLHDGNSWGDSDTDLGDIRSGSGLSQMARSGISLVSVKTG